MPSTSQLPSNPFAVDGMAKPDPNPFDPSGGIVSNNGSSLVSENPFASTVQPGDFSAGSKPDPGDPFGGVSTTFVPPPAYTQSPISRPTDPLFDSGGFGSVLPGGPLPPGRGELPPGDYGPGLVLDPVRPPLPPRPGGGGLTEVYPPPPYVPPPGYNEGGGPTEVYPPPPPPVDTGGFNEGWQNAYFNQNPQFAMSEYLRGRGIDPNSVQGQWYLKQTQPEFNAYGAASVADPNLNFMPFLQGDTGTLSNWWGNTQSGMYTRPPRGR